MVGKSTVLDVSDAKSSLPVFVLPRGPCCSAATMQSQPPPTKIHLGTIKYSTFYFSKRSCLVNITSEFSLQAYQLLYKFILPIQNVMLDSGICCSAPVHWLLRRSCNQSLQKALLVSGALSTVIKQPLIIQLSTSAKRFFTWFSSSKFTFLDVPLSTSIQELFGRTLLATFTLDVSEFCMLKYQYYVLPQALIFASVLLHQLFTCFWTPPSTGFVIASHICIGNLCLSPQHWLNDFVAFHPYDDTLKFNPLHPEPFFLNLQDVVIILEVAALNPYQQTFQKLSLLENTFFWLYNMNEQLLYMSILGK